MEIMTRQREIRATSSNIGRRCLRVGGMLVLMTVLVAAPLSGHANGPDSKKTDPPTIDKKFDKDFPQALEKLAALLRKSLPEDQKLVVKGEAEVQPPGWPGGRGIEIIFQPKSGKQKYPPAQLWIMRPGYDGASAIRSMHKSLPKEMRRWRACRVIGYQCSQPPVLGRVVKALGASDDLKISRADIPNPLHGTGGFNAVNGRVWLWFKTWWGYTRSRIHPLALAAGVEQVVTADGRYIKVSQPLRNMGIDPGETRQSSAYLVLNPPEVNAPLRELKQIRVAYRAVLADRLERIDIPLDPGKTRRINKPVRLDVTVGKIRTEGEAQFVKVSVTMHRSPADAKIAKRHLTSHLITSVRTRPDPKLKPGAPRTGGYVDIQSTILSDDGLTRKESCTVRLNPKTPHSSVQPITGAICIDAPSGLRVVSGTARLELEPSKPAGDPAFGTKRQKLTSDQILKRVFAATDEKANKEKQQQLIELGDPIMPTLLRLLGMPGPKMNIDSSRAYDLVKRIGQPAVPFLLRSAFDGGVAPAMLLGEIGDLRAVEPLIQMLTDGYLKQKPADAPWGRGERHAWIAHALGCLADPRATDSLITALKSDSPILACKAAWALGQIGDPKAIKPLKELRSRLHPFPADGKYVDKKTPDYQIDNAARDAIRDIRRFGPTRYSTLPKPPATFPSKPTTKGKLRLAMLAIRNQVRKHDRRFRERKDTVYGRPIDFRLDDRLGGVHRVQYIGFEPKINVSSITGQEAKVIHTKEPHCAIRIRIWPHDGIRTGQRKYTIDGQTWESKVQVWSSDSDNRLQDEIEKIMHKALSRIGHEASVK